MMLPKLSSELNQLLSPLSDLELAHLHSALCPQLHPAVAAASSQAPNAARGAILTNLITWAENLAKSSGLTVGGIAAIVEQIIAIEATGVTGPALWLQVIQLVLHAVANKPAAT